MNLNSSANKISRIISKSNHCAANFMKALWYSWGLLRFERTSSIKVLYDNPPASILFRTEHITSKSKFELLK